MFRRQKVNYQYRVLQKSATESYPETVYMETVESFETSVNFHGMIENYRSTRWFIWLRHCATSRNVAGSITDGTTGIYP